MPYLWAEILKVGKCDERLRIGRKDVRSAAANLERALRRRYVVPVVWGRHLPASYRLGAPAPLELSMGHVVEARTDNRSLWTLLDIHDECGAEEAVAVSGWSPGGFVRHRVEGRTWPGVCVTHVVCTTHPRQRNLAPLEMSCLFDDREAVEEPFYTPSFGAW